MVVVRWMWLMVVVVAGGCELDRVPQAGTRINPVLAADGGACNCDAGCTPEGQCLPNLPDLPKGADGADCDNDDDCRSGHCGGSICCQQGQCCRTVSDCMVADGQGLACDDASKCEGLRGAPTCGNFICGVMRGTADDRACDETTEANDCGPYKSVYCNGDPDQTPPSCPTRCESNADCDEGFHCTDDKCVPNAKNGEACGQDSHCASGYCGDGICCDGGNCCTTDANCSGSFSTPARCDDKPSCQGTRRDPVCIDSACRTGPEVQDDRACDARTVAMECDMFAAATCNGMADQEAPVCATSCEDNGDCAEGAFCDAADNTCKGELPNGGACTSGAQCASDHCQNGYCCDSGDCCATAADCTIRRTCPSVQTCQGQRFDPICEANRCSGSEEPVEDDSGCAGKTANSCGDFKDVVCTDDPQQSSAVRGCPMPCTGNDDCDPDKTCTGGICG